MVWWQLHVVSYYLDILDDIMLRCYITIITLQSQSCKSFAKNVF